MAINLLKLKNKATGSENYGFLVDQIDIRKNQLEADGKLSPGDYDVLISLARKLYTNPALTPEQRSNVSVRISALESDYKANKIKDTSDIDRLNRDVKDTKITAKTMAVNNPQLFLKANADSEKAKIDRLSDIIAQKESAMDDATKYYDERDQALLDYQDALQALDDVEKKNTASNYAAYVVTNSYGEVVDIKVGKVGTVNGYIPSNGTYGGLPLYGKVNRVDQNGRNVFTIGSQNFVQGNDLVTGPDGVSTVKKLILEGQAQKGSNLSINAASTEVSPNLRAQNEIRRGGWAEGQNGTIYQKGEDGNYTKYLNKTKDELGLKDSDLMKLSTSTEQSIRPYVSKTEDPMSLNVPPPLPPSPTSTPMTTQPTQTEDVPTSTGRAQTGGAPTERSPQTSQGIAGKAMGAVKGFFGNLFGK